MGNDSKKIFILTFCGFTAAKVLYYFWQMISSIITAASWYFSRIYILNAFSSFFSCLAFLALLAFVAVAAFEDFSKFKPKIEKLWFLPGSIQGFALMLSLIFSFINGIRALNTVSVLLSFLAELAMAASLMVFFPKLLMEKFKKVEVVRGGIVAIESISMTDR